MSFCYLPTEIDTFLRTNGDSPNWLLIFSWENTHSENKSCESSRTSTNKVTTTTACPGNHPRFCVWIQKTWQIFGYYVFLHFLHFYLSSFFSSSSRFFVSIFLSFFHLFIFSLLFFILPCFSLFFFHVFFFLFFLFYYFNNYFFIVPLFHFSIFSFFLFIFSISFSLSGAQNLNFSGLNCSTISQNISYKTNQCLKPSQVGNSLWGLFSFFSFFFCHVFHFFTFPIFWFSSKNVFLLFSSFFFSPNVCLTPLGALHGMFVWHSLWTWLDKQSKLKVVAAGGSVAAK